MARELRRDGGHDERDVAEVIAQLIVDKVGDKLAAKAAASAEKIATKAERLSQHAARHAADFDRLSDHLDALDVWMRSEPSSRRPRFSREDIAEAAVRIADAEGFEALSMRRLAAELGAGTMTLYHYVRTKDELLTMVNDAVMGEVVVPDDEPLPDDWRAALTVVACRTRDVMRRHPWILDIRDDPPIGPNSLRHFDQSMQAVSTMPAELAVRIDLVTAVDEFTFGFCMHERTSVGEELTPHLEGYIAELLATGDFPHLSALVGDRPVGEAMAELTDRIGDPQRFERNLARLLDGFEPSA
jgi:AcrR family transcriptional regulator